MDKIDIARAGRIVCALTGAASLGACTSFSFAPPRVETERKIAQRDFTNCSQYAEAGAVEIEPNVKGTNSLIDNFVEAYRCAAREAADGRQTFEVPSMLALVAAAIGPAFGLTDDGSLAAAASAAVLGRANSYYAPKDKAKYLNSALDGVLCVQTAAIGVGFFDTSKSTPSAEAVSNLKELTNKTADLQNQLTKLGESRGTVQTQYQNIQTTIANLPATTSSSQAAAVHESQAALSLRLSEIDIAVAEAQTQLARAYSAQVNAAVTQLGSQADRALVIREDLPGGHFIEIDLGVKYFRMVSAALLSIERILGQRFSDVGSFDAEGLSAQFAQIIQDKEDLPDTPPPVPGAGVGLLSVQEQQARKTAESFKLDLDKLQPELQECVVRAKI